MPDDEDGNCLRVTREATEILYPDGSVMVSIPLGPPDDDEDDSDESEA